MVVGRSNGDCTMTKAGSEKWPHEELQNGGSGVVACVVHVPVGDNSSLHYNGVK